MGVVWTPLATPEFNPPTPAHFFLHTPPPYFLFFEYPRPKFRFFSTAPRHPPTHTHTAAAALEEISSLHLSVISQIGIWAFMSEIDREQDILSQAIIRVTEEAVLEAKLNKISKETSTSVGAHLNRLITVDCPDCSKIIYYSDDNFQCELCDHWYHISCQHVSKAVFKLLDQNACSKHQSNCLHWYCDTGAVKMSLS